VHIKENPIFPARVEFAESKFHPSIFLHQNQNQRMPSSESGGKKKARKKSEKDLSV